MPTTPQNQKKQKVILGIVLAAFVFILLVQSKQYIKLPTQARIEKLTKQIQDARKDLLFAEQEKEQLNDQMDEIRQLSEPLWISTGQRSIEQEVRFRFESIARDARVTLKSSDIQRAKNTQRTNVQEVNIRFEVESLTMQDLELFFVKLQEYMDTHKQRFGWSSFKITSSPVRIQRQPGPPGMPQPPTPQANSNARTLKLNATVKAYALTPEASDFIYSSENFAALDSSAQETSTKRGASSK